MTRIVLLVAALATMASVFACSKTTGATPTEAYKLLYAAVKSKNIEAIKKQLSQKSVEFGEMAAQQQKKALDEVYKNGFTATTFSDTLPQMRDERVDGDMGALEVWNAKDRVWEDLAFVKEDGAWKLAVGDMFAGTYKSPGPGQDLLEKQAANSAANSQMPAVTANNANAPIIIQKPNPIASNNPALPKQK
jgi:hypothetical protein